MDYLLTDSMKNARLLGRIWLPSAEGPAVVTLRGEMIHDITSALTPTVRDLLERDDAADYVAGAKGTPVAPLAEIAENSRAQSDPARPYFLSPADLQAVKAAGVTFAQSMVERVIEEQAAGDAHRAEEIRARVGEVIGASLRGIVPGSPEAAKVKELLQREGLWSQYLEVGIGPDAEVFTKCQPMASVGWGAAVGLHPMSEWNNPEPEIVLAVSSRGVPRGAALGNDVNLRDVEGRSALLLSKAKDNNASCAIGPFIRLFDETFTMESVRSAEIGLRVEGRDGFVLEGRSSMKMISRDPLDLVAQTVGRHHQYPDGFMLFLGTLFAPVQDRGAKGQGFTHHIGDRVVISEPQLGRLENIVLLATECPEWKFGGAALMRNLARRGLL